MDNTNSQNTITLGGEEVPYVFCYLPQMDLKFYPENPRIYSVVFTGDATPTQAEIQERLEERDHVKELAQSIQANKGLIDPLWVRDGDFLVIEGNSRLAAYRILSRKDPVTWGKVKCHLLPKDIDDNKIFSFLCQCHVVGRQDWAPYEQAGIIWRRYKHHGDSPEYMSKEMGMSLTEVKRLIEVYSFMDANNDTAVQHWSYYYEYLKSRKIQAQREIHPELDKTIVKRVKSNEISRAEDIRDKVTKIAGVGGQIIQDFIDKPKSLDIFYEKAMERSEDTALYRALNRFRIKIGDLDTKKSIQGMSQRNRQRCKFELNKIKGSVTRLLKLIELNNK
jgi:hypothetical protein